jgi:hypothetical protein
MNSTIANDLQVNLLAPHTGLQSVESVLGMGQMPAEPFSSHRRQTLGQLSRMILHDAELRADAGSVALGYWLRPANISGLAEQFERRRKAEQNVVFVPAGRVFHVAPGNVDTMFVYSWALSYLCGNLNVVRVSGQQNEILLRLLSVLSRQMQEDPELAEGNRFLTYEHDDNITGMFSNWSAHRVLWGGDETVSMLRRLPLSPHASERAFGSKFSFSVISIEAYLGADPVTASKLAAGFFNDIFWFDQMACSSPHLLVWVGHAEQLDAALDRFDSALSSEIERRNYRGAASNTIHRLNFAFDMACDTDLRVDLSQKEFLAIRIPGMAGPTKKMCGAGLFTHRSVDHISRVIELCEQRDQTITHFGFSEAELFEFAAKAGARGVDRLVPVGEALSFDAIWDGYDLMGDFLRRVIVRPSL